MNEKNSFQIIAIMLRHCWLAADNNDGDDGKFDTQWEFLGAHKV